jgi:hypothetical protein
MNHFVEEIENISTVMQHKARTLETTERDLVLLIQSGQPRAQKVAIFK